MADEKKPESETTKLGHFIQTYSAFLSSFVIGVAGLIATTIYQWRQAEMAQHQATSQEQQAEIKAANDWRIERAEILSKNLSILSSHGPDTADQRYGVLLSLTRGNILDPELAVSYALELGKDNPAYMKSVLASTEGKSYLQLLQSFRLTCLQHYGVVRDVDACKADKDAQRSTEISALISDEQTAANTQHKPGPSSLLADAQQVENSPQRLAWLFEPYLSDLYDRRQFAEIERFEASSVGARLIAALDLATAHTGEFVAAEEANVLAKFHSERRKWLASYVFGRTCDGECKARLIDAMLSVYGDAQGDYDDTMRKLIVRTRAEVGPAIGKLHKRLLWCQVDDEDLEEFRDSVLVPALTDALEGKSTDQVPIAATASDDIAALLALVPAPKDGAGLAPYDHALELLKKSPERYQKSFVNRRNVAERERKDPPESIKHVMFCNAPEIAGPAGVPE